jgi:hypothetical protein
MNTDNYLTSMSPKQAKTLHDKQQAIIDQVLQEMKPPLSITLSSPPNDSSVAEKALWDGVSTVASTTDLKTLDADEKKGRWPDFFRVARNLQRAVIEFKGGTGGYGDKKPDNEITDDDPKLEDATGISSLVHPRHNMPGLHKIVLDIDHDAVLVKSSTPHHHHLIVDHYVNWEDYQELLRAMAKCGMIQKGYAEGSIKQGASWLRTPWATKGGTTVDFVGVYNMNVGPGDFVSYTGTVKSMTWSEIKTTKAQLQQLMMEKEIEKKEKE